MGGPNDAFRGTDNGGMGWKWHLCVRDKIWRTLLTHGELQCAVFCAEFMRLTFGIWQKTEVLCTWSRGLWIAGAVTDPSHAASASSVNTHTD